MKAVAMGKDAPRRANPGIGFMRTAWIAALFSTVVLAAMVWNALASRASDPTPPTQIDTLVARLNVDKRNAALMADLRKQDLWLRTEYVRSRRFAQTGGWLLLLGIGTFLGCLRAAERVSRRPPAPAPQAPERAVADLLGQQRGVLALGLFLGGGLALVSTLSRHDTAASYVVGGAMPSAGATAPDKEPAGIPLAVLPPPSTPPASTSSSGSGPVSGAGLSSQPAPIGGQLPAPSGPMPLTANTTSLVPLSTPATAPNGKPTTSAATPVGCTPLASDGNWSMFRGSNGIAITAGEYPTKLEAVLWKTPIAAPGHNSPVVWGDRIFLTGATATKREVFAFDANTGKPVWTSEIPLLAGSGPMKASNDAGFAPATVAADAEHLVAVFVNGDVACLRHDGKPLWGRAFGPLENSYGHASSPVLAAGRLILQVDQGSAPDEGKSTLYALDPKTGKTIWQVKRPVSASWSTPLVLNRGSKPLLVTAASPTILAYDLADGKEIWRAEGMMGEVAPSPAYGNGVVYAAQMGAGLLAIDAATGKVLWNTSDPSLPDIVSPAYAEGFVFVAGPDGTFTAVEAKTGKIAWEKKLLKGAKSSPVAVGDRIYVIDGAGTAHVVGAKGAFEEIASTSLGEPVQATPAFVRGRIYVRGEKSLFCLGAP